MDISYINNYIKELPNYNSIESLPLYDGLTAELIKEIERLESKDNVQITIYQSPSSSAIVYVDIKSSDDLSRTICISDTNSLSENLMYWNHKYPYPKWIDTKVNDNYFTRTVDNIRYHIEHGEEKYWEKLYNYREMIMESRAREIRSKYWKFRP